MSNEDLVERPDDRLRPANMAAAKRAYRGPVLVRLGTVADLTRGHGGSAPESGLTQPA